MLGVGAERREFSGERDHMGVQFISSHCLT